MRYFRNAHRAMLPAMFVAAILVVAAPGSQLVAQSELSQTEPVDGEPITAPQTVEVEPVANDQQIEARLLSILEATTWFRDPKVEVDEGVVFLSGGTSKDEHRTWAGDLARSTRDVVAVVNRIRVIEGPLWDLSLAWAEMESLAREFIQTLPLLVLGLILLILTYIFTLLCITLSRRIFARRIENHLLVGVISKALAVPIFLLGLYFVLRVTGLTQMAATVLGGTGLIGLVIGIAFRDIAENFLASVLLSVQRPFALGDLIEVQGELGIVQSVTTRGTLLMTPEGNHVQIPNSALYKSVIINRSSNPNIRCDFVILVDYRDTIATAQSCVMKILDEHQAVLNDPEPMVLVEELSSTTASLRAYFWVNDHETSAMKVKSSVIRMARAALQQAGLHVPATAHALLFPDPVPHIDMNRGGDDRLADRSDGDRHNNQRPSADRSGDAQTIVNAERGFKNDHEALVQQAQNARSPEPGPNLLAD